MHKEQRTGQALGVAWGLPIAGMLKDSWRGVNWRLHMYTGGMWCCIASCVAKEESDSMGSNSSCF
jgi:hypothetical protein